MSSSDLAEVERTGFLVLAAVLLTIFTALPAAVILL